MITGVVWVHPCLLPQTKAGCILAHTAAGSRRDEEDEDEGEALMGGGGGEAEGRPVRITVPSTVEQVSCSLRSGVRNISKGSHMMTV